MFIENIFRTLFWSKISCKLLNLSAYSLQFSPIRCRKYSGLHAIFLKFKHLKIFYSTWQLEIKTWGRIYWIYMTIAYFRLFSIIAFFIENDFVRKCHDSKWRKILNEFVHFIEICFLKHKRK